MSELILLPPGKLEKVLSQNGCYFKNFTLTVEGQYTDSDVAFNIADVPHHHHIHDVMADTDLVVDDHIYSKLRVQNIFPFLKLPILVIGYKYASHSYCHYFSLMGIHIINDITMSSGDSYPSTRVESKYRVGLPFPLLWMRPLVNMLLRRNFQALAKDDLPLRERRGQLRKMGVDFTTQYDELNYGPSYKDTQDVHKDNVILTKEFFNHKEQLSIKLKDIDSN